MSHLFSVVVLACSSSWRERQGVGASQRIPSEHSGRGVALRCFSLFRSRNEFNAEVILGFLIVRSGTGDRHSGLW